MPRPIWLDETDMRRPTRPCPTRDWNEPVLRLRSEDLRKAKAIPLVADRQKVADSLIRSLLSLGLERKPTVLPALAGYVLGKCGGRRLGPRARSVSQSVLAAPSSRLA